MIKFKVWFLIFWLILTTNLYVLISQSFVSSPATWLFPNGNPQGTRNQPIRSFEQNISNFLVKWKSKSLSGDVQILVGNVIKDSIKIDENFPYEPNEIVGVVGGKIFIVDGKGYTHKTNSFGFQYVKNVSILFDTLSTTYFSNPTSTVVLGLETIEFENQKDSLIYTYIAGYDKKADTIALIKRLVLDMREYKPNVFGSIKPFFGRRFGNDFLVFASTNIIKPIVNNQNPVQPPFFRGFSVYSSNNVVYTFPLPDITDNKMFRVTLGPEVSFAQPSLYQEGGNFYVTMPNFASLESDVNVPCIISLDRTNAQSSYLLSYTLVNNQIRQKFPPLDLRSILDTNGKRPRIRPLFVTLNNSATADSVFILVAEEYLGIDSSFGQSRLHLFDVNGNAITLPNDFFTPSFVGKNNHIWSIAVGNVDGYSANSFTPYYPNNPGKEIIVTHSSKFSSVPNSRLMILRYNAGNPVPKANPPNSFLFPFDTICTASISGWVAAVNDLDGAPDGKEEIVLVDGSKLLVLRLRDYSSFDFRLGKPFDTLYLKEFANETIMDAIVADLEGDGKNDIIVQTNSYIYLIGSPLPKLIEVINPIFDEFVVREYCYGDTLEIILKSKAKSENDVNIRFVPLVNNQSDYVNSVILSKGIRIDKETTFVKVTLTKNILGKMGIIYVENAKDTTQIFDSTGVFQFTGPTFVVDTAVLNQTDSYRNAKISFSTICIDTLIFEYSLDKNQWIPILQIVFPQIFETRTISFPCPNSFDFSSPVLKYDIALRAIYGSKDLKDTSAIFFKSVKPEEFQIEYDTSTTLCCTKFFKWNLPTCDTMVIFFSIDGGNSFKRVAVLPARTNNFVFEQERNFPESIHFRLVCENECLVADTVLSITKPSIINTVAPNPFNPKIEQVEISFVLKNDADVTIKIIDQANRLVRNIIEHSPKVKDTYYCVYWDGLTLDNKICEPGLYYILVETSDGIQEIFPIFVK